MKLHKSLLAMLVGAGLITNSSVIRADDTFWSKLAQRLAVNVVDAVPNLILMGGMTWITNKVLTAVNPQKPMNPKQAKKINLRNYVGTVPKEIKTFLDQQKNPTAYKTLNVNPPSGILLYGPPGTGKTLLARCIAGELNAPFFSIKPSDVASIYISATALAIKKLFADAKSAALKSKNKTAVIFIDEMEVLAGTRSTVKSAYNESVSELLTQMDGLDHKDPTNKARVNIVVIGATNLKEMIDPALLRAGRFDYKIEIPNPDNNDLAKIARFYLNKRPHTLEAKTLIPKMIEKISSVNTCSAMGTPAEVNGLIEEAARLAAFKSKKYVSHIELEQAFYSKTKENITNDFGKRGLQLIISDDQENALHPNKSLHFHQLNSNTQSLR